MPSAALEEQDDVGTGGTVTAAEPLDPQLVCQAP